MNPTSRKNHALQAFTLLEIMLVVAIISLLLGVAIYNITGAKTSAEFVAAETNIQTISTQLSTYEVNAARLPTNEQGLEALVNRPRSGPEPKRWIRLMKKLPLDPWGQSTGIKTRENITRTASTSSPWDRMARKERKTTSATGKSEDRRLGLCYLFSSLKLTVFLRSHSALLRPNLHRFGYKYRGAKSASARVADTESA